jgi:hypothetical protein
VTGKRADDKERVRRQGKCQMRLIGGQMTRRGDGERVRWRVVRNMTKKRSDYVERARRRGQKKRGRWRREYWMTAKRRMTKTESTAGNMAK